MTIKRKTTAGISIGRLMSVGLMLVCLTFLTSLNYFTCPSGPDDTSLNIFGLNTEETENDYPPSGPTEEKSGNSGISISEEILHESHPELNFQASNLIYLHHIAEAENIEMFHPELIVPPPKFSA